MLIVTLALVTGNVLDSASTAIALTNPLFAGQFQEVGNVFIKFLMYDLGMGANGFYAGLCITWAFEILVIWRAYATAEISSYKVGASQTLNLLYLMILLAIGHWVAAVQNLQLLFPT